jgi:hypothetical protein
MKDTWPEVARGLTPGGGQLDAPIGMLSPMSRAPRIELDKLVLRIVLDIDLLQ